MWLAKSLHSPDRRLLCVVVNLFVGYTSYFPYRFKKTWRQQRDPQRKGEERAFTNASCFVIINYPNIKLIVQLSRILQLMDCKPYWKLLNFVRIVFLISSFQWKITSWIANTRIIFHQKCRAKYKNKRSVHYTQTDAVMCDGGLADDEATCTSGLACPQRFQTSQFSLRSDCFICEKCHAVLRKRNWHRSQLERGPQKILEAAIIREMTEIQMLMLSHFDLFAVDTKYHHSCYAHYISLNIIKAVSRAKANEDKSEITFNPLCKENESTQLSKTTTSQLSVPYGCLVAISVEVDSNTSMYSTRKLKEKLQKCFGDKISFRAQHGKSSLV